MDAHHARIVQNGPVEVAFCQVFVRTFLLELSCHLISYSMKISDEKLLQLCERFGRRALLWRRKFIGLLPEVNRRRLYERRGCQSIFEFAAKLAGVSEEQVRRAVNLSYEFRDKPALQQLLTSGSVGLSKLARVASVATPENEFELAEKVRLLPQKALETLVRDERVSEKQNGSAKPLFEVKSVRAHMTFELSVEVVEELNCLHEQGQDVNAILLELLAQRKLRIEQKKEVLAGEAARSRTIPTKIRRVLHEEYGQKCSIATCQKPSEEIHHTQRFSLSHSHDPHYLAPLCREHHQLAHAVDVRVQELRAVSSGFSIMG